MGGCCIDNVSVNQSYLAVFGTSFFKPNFSNDLGWIFNTIPECDRHTHTVTAYTALSIASHGKRHDLITGHRKPSLIGL